MSNLLGLLDLGGSGLLSHQKAIQVTGHNIANVNTPGYTRQRVNLEAKPPMANASGQAGTGVNVIQVQRIYDRFLGVQINAENQDLGRWEAQKGALEITEIIFDELSGSGLNAAMSELWNSWQDVANNPSGYTERAALLSKSRHLATTFNNISSEIQQQQIQLDLSIDATVNEINRMAGQIFDLNKKISNFEISGQGANDYRDKREELLKELSSKIDINTFEDSRGRIAVSVGNGQPLVDNSYPWKLSTQTNAFGHADVVWMDNDGNTVNITQDISGGKLKGWLQARDTDLADYLTRLDTLAGEMIVQVNSLHTAGFDLNGTGGEVFFTGTSAADISLNSNIDSDVNLIAAAVTASGIPGDNRNAIAIANLQHALVMNGGSATFDNFYNSIVTDVGNGVKTAVDYFEHQSTITASLENYRQSHSGVSLDEEMLNLVKFQHAYDAAAKLISTVDELLTTVVNMI
jgi:flagellar hook-associated protein 1 FlgK